MYSATSLSIHAQPRRHEDRGVEVSRWLEPTSRANAKRHGRLLVRTEAVTSRHKVVSPNRETVHQAAKHEIAARTEHMSRRALVTRNRFVLTWSDATAAEGDLSDSWVHHVESVMRITIYPSIIALAREGPDGRRALASKIYAASNEVVHNVVIARSTLTADESRLSCCGCGGTPLHRPRHP